MSNEQLVDFRERYSALVMRFARNTGVPSIGKLSKLMIAGGKLFHQSRNLFSFPKFPVWLKPRTIEQVCYDGQEEHIAKVVHWDTYFWTVVVWLARSIPESAVDLPYLKRKPESSWLSGDFFAELLPLLINDSTDKLRESTRRSLADACCDACEYLQTKIKPLANKSRETDSPPARIVEPTKPVSLKEASHWFQVDARTLKKWIDDKKVTAEKQSGRRWVFDLFEVSKRNPKAKNEADPETAPLRKKPQRDAMAQ